MASWDQTNDASSYFSNGPPMPGPSPYFESAGQPNPQPRPSLAALPTHNPQLAQASYRHPNVPRTANNTPAFTSGSQWAPADLLSPRGSNQPSPRQRRPESFDSPGGTPPPYHAHPSPQQYNGGMGMGMGNMLERMHNVADRATVPQKRRKIYEDPADNRRKPEFNGDSGSGVLGSYMKEKKEQGQREAASKGTLVDISAVEDDEVEVISDPGGQEVCYGRIEGADINAFRVPTPKPGSKAVSNGFWPQVKILLRRKEGERHTCVHAIDSTRAIIGCLDVNTAIGLVPLLDSKFGIRTSCRILTRPRKEDDKPAGTEVSRRYGLDLNIYGPKKYAIQIGRHLSQKQLWLRTPLFVEAGIPLHNPHTIERPPQSAVRPLASRQQGPTRTTEEIRNDLIGMFDSLEKSEDLKEMDPDPRITTPLLKHQKQGLYFMTNKEKERVFSSDEKGNSSLWRLRIGNSGQKTYYNVITGQEERQSPPQILGGILADMMGLGKTLSILSLVVNTMDNDALQWAALQPYAEQYSKELCQLKKGKTALPPKVEQTALVRNCKTTLLVSPLSTIANWEDQIKQHIIPGTLSYYIYHGSNRIKDVNKLAEYDLVITTYGSVASELGHRGKQKVGIYPLEEMNWFRIVLDEAHMIREQSTQQSKAICRLQSSRRWAVTGTPVQNRLEDLGALMTFLRVKPFDERGGFAQYIMAPFKMCDPDILPKLRLLVDSITLRRLKDRIDLPSRTDQLVKLDFSPEERHIYEIFAKNAHDRVKVIVGQREKSLGGRAYVHILQSILRLRLICAHGRDLLNEDDLQVMNGLSKDSAIEVDSDDEDEDRPALSSKQAYDMYALMGQTNADICITCNRKIGPSDTIDEGEAKDPVIAHMTPCFHLLCPACFGGYKSQIEENAQGQSMGGCPICHMHIKLSYFPLRQGGVEDEGPKMKGKGNTRHGTKDLANYSGPHTKTKALIHDLLASKQESEQKPKEAPIKSVVFSGWTTHLDLIQHAFQENGLKYVRLDGKMSRTARAIAMDNFRDDPSIHVILVSITAGGLGLNLTAANKVYVMEPQYNPAAEAQAVDRVHRLGQKREVVTVRYIMSDSFEEKMLELQEKKKKLASLSMDSDVSKRMGKDEASRKRLEDLRSLFK
ncbi:putative SWI/SNF-related matrix-associated actin-dependent regulator of chromatin subfamily A member 3-like [Lachnellula subtilissima]|uniref:Putative SWI/SNF-related matrix-associated actin-dependent regulator of chromatin subfamily A member 3-like n=1 Tax=Lachnellula subtilissima TaxID=602034 RepID=A0A8H8UBR6_9HELO|nr:putative SWI/SNF-related matrix-associated actin-dependent regulator of chromatin subfamily A member 3-like [Lachnellula subtilissima]